MTSIDTSRFRSAGTTGPTWQKFLANREIVTAFDVGANRGQTVERLVQIFPKVSIHAFEPSPSTFAELSQALAGHKGLTLNNRGVGSQTSEMDFIENTNSDMSSFLELGPEGWGGIIQHIKVPVTTVDDYSAERGVEHIHLLKIDTQGFDFEAQTKCWRGDGLTFWTAL